MKTAHHIWRYFIVERPKSINRDHLERYFEIGPVTADFWWQASTSIERAFRRMMLPENI